ncbi:SDR family oxidoreductase [Streptomyces sp. NBC_00140]|uniref:SDR family oxidoreductase n=1 Tax=Streptomyces sp. NBC_00140 TaxID=2975664 RepID=UPI00225964FD|nr:SDR family oxidoreductase [Streptomyces sp. NBC_00140]MCX5333302.1 SDR family oxidoreductase [Streptomyces sp. NBC_00140]
MRVFVTGASGFVGSAVVRELLGAGHQVVGLARSDSSAAALTAAGAEVHRGDLDDLDSLRRGAAAADGVIHTAFKHDFSNIAASGVIDLHAIEAMGATLEGTCKPLVTTSAFLVAPGVFATEEDAADPASVAPFRVPSEEATLALAERGVRATVVRLPPSVHGHDDGGFVPRLIDIARDRGVSAMVGDGANHWPAVHRLDAARLFRLALEKAPAGIRLHAIGDEGVPLHAIATAIGHGLDFPVVRIPHAEAAAHFGWIGHFVSLSLRASSALTQQRLDWKPEEAGLLADLADGHYFEDGRTSKL